MFHTKICGVRTKTDTDWVAKSGADAIGLNFFPPSVRYVDPQFESTQQLGQYAKESGLLVVGVFVNAPTVKMLRIAEQIPLDVIQLHGDEPNAQAIELIKAEHRVIRAVKLPTVGLTKQNIDDVTEIWRDHPCHLLLDADGGAQHGGSGKQLDWIVVRQWAAQWDASWTLAGGLNAVNVAQAVQDSNAPSVDTASGVEQPRGTKSRELIEVFVKSRKAASNRQ